ncbi:hypothetical protein GCM10011573_35240 [Enterococcus wangshanyuanii]|uniref:Uncharacterized protein n=1 Tax=Enterococcus wangshanyuanii TaxID=2005703 RepID=A0ABQ1PT48_9ENTE|nr:hypothetical protein GCM10011573_35240 [Enterococcus wangshanyuanii]
MAYVDPVIELSQPEKLLLSDTLRFARAFQLINDYITFYELLSKKQTQQNTLLVNYEDCYRKALNDKEFVGRPITFYNLGA